MGDAQRKVDSVPSRVLASTGTGGQLRKEEAEAKLQCGVLGPIEDFLEAVATEWRLPAYAIGMCLLRMEEAAPALRALLVKTAD